MTAGAQIKRSIVVDHGNLMTKRCWREDLRRRPALATGLRETPRRPEVTQNEPRYDP